ncbi:MAG: hypothetical protein KGO02_12580 [Alphaproteobacteria bacterium]|nr:hypothetical protein [Alphaproteobacteria bacterium]
MARLTANQEAFIDRMTQGEEYAQQGFGLLLQHERLEDFFEPLRDAGLLAPTQNRGPEPADQPGYYRIPYWPALDYLVAVAKKADANRNLALAAKVINVVLAATQHRDEAGNHIDNYHTYRQFAEILATLPVDSITDELVDLVPIWLSGRFDTGLVGSVLGSRVIPRLLGSEFQGAISKACRILGYATRVKWVDQKFGETTRREPMTSLDDYWLGELIKKNAADFGRRAGREALEAIRGSLVELFSDPERKRVSWLMRPAVEDHEQNRRGNDPENRLIDAFRDILVSWIGTDVAAARPYVANIVQAGPEILRRIGIYCVNSQFELLQDLVPTVLPVAFVDTNLLHESYDFLSAHFLQLADAQKAAVLDSLRDFVVDPNLEDREKRLKTIQRRWLTAIKGKGYEPADRWFAQLSADLGYGAEEEDEDTHPNFHSYMTSYWGFGKSPYSSDELIAFAREGTFVQKVNEFEPGQKFRGPTVRGLIDAVEEAVVAEPKLFIAKIDSYDQAKNFYKYAIISGAKKLWDKNKDAADDLDWHLLWKVLLDYLDALTGKVEFRTAPDQPSEGYTPDRHWISSLIADFLRAGTLSDDHSYPAEYLPIGERILLRLLDRAEPNDGYQGSDPMTHAINTTKGRVIEALVTHTLRSCRVADKAGNGHAAVWQRLSPVYDKELAKSANANFEFATLMGAYIENMRYVSAEWVDANFEKLFPVQYRETLRCVMEGLAHAPVSKKLYEQLRDHGVIIHVLHDRDESRHGRENIVERIGLAYLWNTEPLNGPIFNEIRDAGYEADAVHIGHWFWTLRRSDVNDDQVKQIIQYWKWCLEWVSREPKSPTHALSTLGLLACYIDEVNEETFELLQVVAPRMQDEHHDTMFAKELARLAEAAPQRIGLVVKEMLTGFTPILDYENSLRDIVLKVAEVDKELAMELADRLRKLQGFLTIYDNLEHAP